MAATIPGPATRDRAYPRSVADRMRPSASAMPTERTRTTPPRTRRPSPQSRRGFVATDLQRRTQRRTFPVPTVGGGLIYRVRGSTVRGILRRPRRRRRARRQRGGAARRQRWVSHAPDREARGDRRPRPLRRGDRTGVARGARDRAGLGHPAPRGGGRPRRRAGRVVPRPRRPDRRRGGRVHARPDTVRPAFGGGGGAG